MEGHPSIYPDELVYRLIKMYSYEGDIVLDPFLGSGTTLIASESTGRVCYGTEIAPQYVDVIVKRWQDYTGKEATLDGDGRTFNEMGVERGRGAARAARERRHTRELFAGGTVCGARGRVDLLCSKAN